MIDFFSSYVVIDSVTQQEGGLDKHTLHMAHLEIQPLAAHLFELPFGC